MSKTLLVDFHADELELLNHQFGSRKLRTITAQTGTDALALLTQVRASAVSAIVVDPDLPDMSGEEFLKAVRSLPAHTNTPIVAYSASTDGTQAKRLMELGVWSLILKAPEGTRLVISTLYDGRKLRRR